MENDARMLRSLRMGMTNEYYAQADKKRDPYEEFLIDAGLGESKLRLVDRDIGDWHRWPKDGSPIEGKSVMIYYRIKGGGELLCSFCSAIYLDGRFKLWDISTEDSFDFCIAWKYVVMEEELKTLRERNKMLILEKQELKTNERKEANEH